MKRYFVFGLLTILIITLNFAFIIVLISDDVRINYEVLFLMWVVVILAAVGLAYLEKTKPSNKKRKVRSKREHFPEPPASEAAPKGEAPKIYSKKGIKKFKIQLPQDLTPKVRPGFFSGYVVNEEYAQEKVQAVYTDKDKLLGFISKKKKRLCHNLEELYKKPIICWGEISWDESKKSYKVKGYIPILYDQRDMNRFKNLIRLKRQLLDLEASPQTISPILFLEKAERFLYLQQAEITAPSLDYHIEDVSVEALCKKLLHEGEGEKILRLKEFPILVNRLSQPLKVEVLQAIKKAEKAMAS